MSKKEEATLSTNVATVAVPLGAPLRRQPKPQLVDIASIGWKTRRKRKKKKK